MDIKARITELLQKDKHTFKELADYLNLSEEDLTEKLNHKTLELRKLETLSKVLRVPLYSFFRADALRDHGAEKPYYIHRLWNEHDESKSLLQLTREIEMLKQILSEKEEKVRKLRS